MTFKEIQELVETINSSNLTEFRMKDGEFEITIRTDKYTKVSKVAPQVIQAAPSVMPAPVAPVAAPAPVAATPAPAPVAAPSATDADAGNYLEIKSPIVGTFYRSSSPEKPAFVGIGDTVEEGKVVCIVEAMKLFNEIESEVSGKIVKVLVEDAQPVEYDQVLFLVEPN